MYFFVNLKTAATRLKAGTGAIVIACRPRTRLLEQGTETRPPRASWQGEKEGAPDAIDANLDQYLDQQERHRRRPVQDPGKLAQTRLEVLRRRLREGEDLPPEMIKFLFLLPLQFPIVGVAQPVVS